jgi:5-(carboxyamino)imidazole ribonucleotide mutase
MRYLNPSNLELRTGSSNFEPNLNTNREASTQKRERHVTLRRGKIQPRVAEQPLVAVVMGSSSDWETMKHAVEMLERFGVPFERHIVSAHRTPVWMAEFATGAEARGVEVIIAGAGGAAHLPGMVAAHTVVPVLGVPVQSAALQGLDSLLSIAQMPGGVPVGTLAIGKAGARNAALLAAQILALSDARLARVLVDRKRKMADAVPGLVRAWPDGK